MVQNEIPVQRMNIWKVTEQWGTSVLISQDCSWGFTMLEGLILQRLINAPMGNNAVAQVICNGMRHCGINSAVFNLYRAYQTDPYS